MGDGQGVSEVRESLCRLVRFLEAGKGVLGELESQAVAFFALHRLIGKLSAPSGNFCRAYGRFQMTRFAQ